jgi:hypothetical protein
LVCKIYYHLLIIQSALGIKQRVNIKTCKLDLFLPLDLDVMFSAAFALVLVDTITPATEEQWDIKDAFLLLDYMIGRGIYPATVYKEHLVELNEFRIMVRQNESQKFQRAPYEVPQHTESVQNMPSLGDIGRDLLEPGSNLYVEQESIWAWMSMHNNDLAVLRPDMMQTAITGLNHSSMPHSMDFDADNQWLWGNDGTEGGMNHLPL